MEHGARGAEHEAWGKEQMELGGRWQPRRTLLGLACLVVLFVAGGANCHRKAWDAGPPPPTVFQTEPTLADVVHVVNQNRAMIHSLYSTRASVSTPGFPALKATLAVGSPRRIRLQAGTGLAGSELDLGSNEQVFWVWVKRSEPQAMFVGYHDRLVDSQARQMIPVEPEWLIEAIGLVYLDPNLQLEGPWRRPDGRLEVRARVPSPEGMMTKTLVLDGRSGWIYEQHLYDARGQLLASAINSKHVLDPVTGGTLPYQTDIQWHPTNRSLKLQFHEVQINPPQLNEDLWAKPEYPGYPNIDVTQPRAPAGLPPPTPQVAPRATAWQPHRGQPVRQY